MDEWYVRARVDYGQSWTDNVRSFRNHKWTTTRQTRDGMCFARFEDRQKSQTLN